MASLRFIAYFQSFTNTYGDLERLEALYRETLAYPEVVALSLGTRPDCLGDAVMGMLSRLNEIKPVWIELGLQTAHDETAARMNRCWPTAALQRSHRRENLFDDGQIRGEKQIDQRKKPLRSRGVICSLYERQ